MIYDATYLDLEIYSYLNEKDFIKLDQYLKKYFKIYEYYQNSRSGMIIKPLEYKKGLIKRLKNWLHKEDIVFSLIPTVYEVKYE